MPDINKFPKQFEKYSWATKPKLLHSTFDCGFRAIGATVDLVVPASFFVLSRESGLSQLG